MTPAELRQFARVGAEARLAQLQQEIEAIYSMFPDLRSGSPRQAAGATSNGRRKRRRRRRRTMSAAARKAVSLAQKKRWAEWRRKKR
jgi:hypothetical protein